MTNYIDSVSSLNTGEDFIPSRIVGTEATILEIHSIIAGGSCEVYYEHDPDDDGTYEVSIPIESLPTGISQGNEIELNMKRNARLRIRNTSGSQSDYAVTGTIVE